MNPVQPEELSALLDGELEPSRARQVRAELEKDPALRLEFEVLSAADAAWRVAAGAAAFTPAVEMPSSVEAATDGDAQGWLPALGVALGILIIARIVLKLAGSDVWAFSLPAISLAVLLAGVMWLVSAEQQLDGSASFLQPAGWASARR